VSSSLQPNATVEVKVQGGTSVRIGNAERLSIIAGPCALESRQHALEMAHALKEIAERQKVGLIYKTSFDKANRTSISKHRGIGLGQALPIFAEVREVTGLPVLTDVHEIDQCAPAAEVIDVLQIPAFLSRQTDLIIAAARTGRVVNIKKGQFLAPWDMKNVVEKALAAGNANVMATERGATFGYNNLVSDMRALAIMAEIGCPVVFDATIRCSSRAAPATPVAATDASCRCWRGRRWPWAWRRCSWKLTRTRTAPPPMGQT
jgi:2-dehydro-3-deoxyphosphooctonate aldolase (KDO 8-P synthase)